MVYRYQVVLVAPFPSIFSITHTAIKVGIVDIRLHTTTLFFGLFWAEKVRVAMKEGQMLAIIVL